MPIPQKEFGFTPDTFNLFRENTNDGERVVREGEMLDAMKQQTERNQNQFTFARNRKNPRYAVG